MFHSTQVQRSTPATTEEIAAALQVLFNSCPPPRGIEPEQALVGYKVALDGFPIEAVTAGIRKFLRGECEGVSRKFCPHPPELADIVRGAAPRDYPSGSSEPLYAYSPPKSAILEREVFKDVARQMVENGVVPRGSIWIPGPLNGNTALGELYGPDPEWEGPRKVAA